MNKWIAEFELEDGDTMPEHMDLEYKGARIDFHCRPMWIPVEEDAPPVGGVCLWCTKQGNVFISAITYRTESISYVGQHGHFSNGLENYGNIVAWMPLPELYKTESEEK